MNKVEHALSHGDAMKIASGAAMPDCPRCGSPSTAPVRHGMYLTYKCTSCGESCRMLFAMSDLTQLKDVCASDAEMVLGNCNVKIVGKFTQP
ncbi:hypothetical protein [Duganella vulcania]|uniref:Uncharacterized protein n=1 Tax=Duganella vulcania TaxID=2692166 RepID=A0A845GI05_9BURK|nr:hypothetical protein [Duganella vulcania]MYM92397.1 hypothetical protein [Duganella vulcania]